MIDIKKFKKKPLYTLGESLRYYRRRLGISSKDLADKLHVSPSLVYKWEENERVPHESIDDLCKYLHIQKEDLFFKDKHILKVITEKLTYGNVKNPAPFYLGMGALTSFVTGVVTIVVSSLFASDVKKWELDMPEQPFYKFDFFVAYIHETSYVLFYLAALLMVIAITFEIVRVRKKRKESLKGKDKDE